MLILKQIYYIPNSRTTNKSKATNLNEQTQIFKYENEILPRIFDIPNNNMYAHNTSLWVSLTTESKEKKSITSVHCEAQVAYIPLILQISTSVFSLSILSHHWKWSFIDFLPAPRKKKNICLQCFTGKTFLAWSVCAVHKIKVMRGI